MSMPFKYNYCRLQFRLKGTTTRKYTLILKCIKFCSSLAFCVHVHVYVHVYMCMCMCMLMYMFMCMTSSEPGWFKSQG